MKDKFKKKKAKRFDKNQTLKDKIWKIFVHQPNIMMFIWNYNNLIKKTKTNHEEQLKINQILKNKIEKKSQQKHNIKG